MQALNRSSSLANASGYPCWPAKKCFTALPLRYTTTSSPTIGALRYGLHGNTRSRTSVQYRNEHLVTQKIALVTGASGGIGRSVTTALAANGFYVFAAARRMDRLETLPADNIEPLQLDVTNAEGIDLAVGHIQSGKGGIDVLVNNAGYGLYGTVEGL